MSPSASWGLVVVLHARRVRSKSVSGPSAALSAVRVRASDPFRPQLGGHLREILPDHLGRNTMPFSPALPRPRCTLFSSYHLSLTEIRLSLSYFSGSV